MKPEEEYLKVNRESWNRRTEEHLTSEFYDVAGFIDGHNALKDIELALFGDVKGKKILHLQCHFGQDTLSLARMGAIVTGVDLSDTAIKNARILAKKIDQEATFIRSDVYDLPNNLDGEFDMVFTSYGTIGWLPDINRWAGVVNRFLKPGGRFIMAEFHPVVWMFDDDFKTVAYKYNNSSAILEESKGTYTNPEADFHSKYISWNHGLAEVVTSLLDQGLQMSHFQEHFYSPYDCFGHTVEFEPGKYRIKHLDDKIPMVYALQFHKKH